MNIKTISTNLLDYNRGQVAGLPKNPIFFRDEYEALTPRAKGLFDDLL